MGVTQRELYPGRVPGQFVTDLDEPPPWLALTVVPQHEYVVRAALELKGLDPYLPTCMVVRRWSDRLKKLERPLFAGYVFCRWVNGNLTPVLRTPGVRSVVSFGGEPSPVPDAEMERIRRILASGLTVEPWPFLQVGQQVRINSGPLAGLEGILVEARDKWRMVVSVEMLQRSVAVEIDRDWATPVQPVKIPAAPLSANSGSDQLRTLRFNSAC